MEDQLAKIEYQVVHTTLGRIRLSIPRLRRDSEYASQLKQLVESFNFCINVRLNPAASSIIIDYEASAISDLVVQEHLCTCIQQACKTIHTTDPTPATPNHSDARLSDQKNSEHCNQGAQNQEAAIEEKVGELVGSKFGEVVGETVGQAVGGLLLGVGGAAIGADIGALLGESLGEECGGAVVHATADHEGKKTNLTPLSPQEVVLEVEHEAQHLVDKLVGLGVGECIGEIVGETVGGMLLGAPGMLIGAEIGACLGGELGEEIAETMEHALEHQEKHKS